jgi:hypothetical protein
MPLKKGGRPSKPKGYEQASFIKKLFREKKPTPAQLRAQKVRDYINENALKSKCFGTLFENFLKEIAQKPSVSRIKQKIKSNQKSLEQMEEQLREGRVFYNEVAEWKSDIRVMQRETGFLYSILSLLEKK